MSGVELTITLRQEGFEQAQAELATLKSEMGTVKTEASILDKVTNMSLQNFVLASGLVINIGLAATDVLGLQIDQSIKSIISTLTMYAQQMAMIAGAHMSTGNVAAAVVFTTVATTIQVKGIMEAKRLGDEAKRQLQGSKKGLASMARLIVSVNR